MSKKMSYEEFKESRKVSEYVEMDRKCFSCGAKPAYWKQGDVRFYCNGCEECADLKYYYEQYLKK
jgi:hypothetical protein